MIKGLDIECISLCKVLNSIKGIRTRGSCCGHGKDVFKIWLESKSIVQLFPIMRQIDRRYAGIPWSLKVELIDVDPGVIFLLKSNKKSGPKVYREAEKMALQLKEFLKNDHFRSVMDSYNVKY